MKVFDASRHYGGFFAGARKNTVLYFETHSLCVIGALLLSKQDPLFTMKTKQLTKFQEQYKKQLFMNLCA